MTEAQAYGAESMTAPLEWALLRRPGQAFGRAFEDPELGFLHPVDLPRAVAEHEALVALLAGLGVDVTVIDEGATGDRHELRCGAGRREYQRRRRIVHGYRPRRIQRKRGEVGGLADIERPDLALEAERASAA